MVSLSDDNYPLLLIFILKDSFLLFISFGMEFTSFFTMVLTYFVLLVLFILYVHWVDNFLIKTTQEFALLHGVPVMDAYHTPLTGKLNR